jgi:hypothetical protein
MSGKISLCSYYHLFMKQKNTDKTLIKSIFSRVKCVDYESEQAFLLSRLPHSIYGRTISSKQEIKKSICY